MENQFKTMAEYKEMFGIKSDGRRSNAILFRCYNDKAWRTFLRENAGTKVCESWRKVDNMAKLRTFGFNVLQNHVEWHNVYLMEYAFYSPSYETDEMNGICEDGTPNAVRYVNLEQNRVSRMKSGKFLMSIINAHQIGAHFPAQLKTFLCEEFSRDWVAYAMSKIGNLELRTDLTFADVYGNGSYSCRDMGSCMNGKEQDGFYDDYVDATPAALVNEEEGEILARCVIFNAVKDEDSGETLRLAERQYAKDGDETLKKALVELLISKGLIDGYKAVGAGCGDSTSFVLNDGTDISDRTLSIICTIDWMDTLSYQDSFKWLDMKSKKAYNQSRRCDAYLDSTDSQLGGSDASYDDYHEEYTMNDVVEVFYDGAWIYCDEERLDDFVRLPNGDYYHENDVFECAYCGEYAPNSESWYSELLDEDFCCMECREKAEEEYKSEHWAYSEFDDAYFEDENDVVTILDWDWEKELFLETSICVESLVRLYLDWRIEKRGGLFYYVAGRSEGDLVQFLNENLAD